MMECTDRHERYFLRRLTRHTLLYTEMVTEAAVLHGDTRRLLGFHADERPLAIQLGGSEPEALARAAAVAASFGYDEINLNVGCPSSRVSSGRFGACLMAEPDRVAECVQAMVAASALPVTVKTRTGIDDLDSYEHLYRFASTVVEAGSQTLIVHARKAWLQGLSPKQNRELPPLQYDRVYQLKQDLPDTEVVLNGGVRTLAEVSEHLRQVDGVMMGREAYRNPYLLHKADQTLFDTASPRISRHSVVRAMYPYIEAELDAGTRLTHITRHMLGLFQGVPGAKAWRRWLSENAHRPDADLSTVEQALLQVPEATPA